MFERDVLMPDGRVLTHHEVTELHHLRGESTSVNVRSWDQASSHDWVLQCELDPTITFEDAEEWAKAQPQFAKCDDERAHAIDEVLSVLTDEQAEQLSQLYPEWAAGTEYAVGDRCRDGLLYRCVQAHTSQDGWEPHATPSLWVRTSIDEWPEWVQPTGAHDAYAMGDKVSHNGSHWVSTMDANVFEPGVAGWESA